MIFQRAWALIPGNIQSLTYIFTEDAKTIVANIPKKEFKNQEMRMKKKIVLSICFFIAIIAFCLSLYSDGQFDKSKQNVYLSFENHELRESILKNDIELLKKDSEGSFSKLGILYFSAYLKILENRYESDYIGIPKGTVVVAPDIEAFSFDDGNILECYYRIVIIEYENSVEKIRRYDRDKYKDVIAKTRKKIWNHLCAAMRSYPLCEKADRSESRLLATIMTMMYALAPKAGQFFLKRSV